MDYFSLAKKKKIYNAVQLFGNKIIMIYKNII